jgi:hypothetical protein
VFLTQIADYGGEIHAFWYPTTDLLCCQGSWRHLREAPNRNFSPQP